MTTDVLTGVKDVVAALDTRYPPALADDWDRVGLVVGEPTAPARRALLAVDCAPETVDEAVAVGADMMIVHHPLLLRGVHSVTTTTHKGALVHRLRSGVALFVAHTNADVATPGVSGALASRLDHPAREHLAGGGPAVLDASHWATERQWLDVLAEQLLDTPIQTVVSDVVTDVWTTHAPSPTLTEPAPTKEPSP